MKRIKPDITLRELLFPDLEEEPPEDILETEKDFKYMEELTRLYLFSRYPLRRQMVERVLLLCFKACDITAHLEKVEVEEVTECYAFEEIDQICIFLGRYPSDLVLEEPNPTYEERKSWLSLH